MHGHCRSLRCCEAKIHVDELPRAQRFTYQDAFPGKQCCACLSDWDCLPVFGKLSVQNGVQKFPEPPYYVVTGETNYIMCCSVHFFAVCVFGQISVFLSAPFLKLVISLTSRVVMLITQAKESNGHDLKPGSLANIDFIPSLFGADSSHTKYVN